MKEVKTNSMYLGDVTIYKKSSGKQTTTQNTSVKFTFITRFLKESRYTFFY